VLVRGRLRIHPGLIGMILAATIVVPAVAHPRPQSAGDPSRDAAVESLPDRDPPASAMEPVVGDVADPRLAAGLDLPDVDDDWGEMLVGVLQQTATRPGPPGSGIVEVQEWFVERPHGEMIAIAVPRRAGLDSDRPAPRRGTRVEVRAVRIGTLEAVSRDDVTRRWPLFAGRPVSTSPMSTTTAAIVAATLLAAGGWFLLRRRLAGRRPRTIREVIGSADRSNAEVSEPPMDLPVDPAEALGVLAQRGGDPEPDA
jgi:hypothetical protein